MGHAGAAQGLNQRLFNHTVFNIQRQLARTLLRRAPAHTVSKAGDIFDFLCLDPFALFGDGSRAVICALGNGAHMLNFRSIDHKNLSFQSILQAIELQAAQTGRYYRRIIPTARDKVKKSAEKSR